MQARFVTLSAIALVLAAAAPAMAEEVGACPEQPVCGWCGADVGVDSPDEAATHGGAEAAQDVFVTEAAPSSQAAYVGGASGGIWKTTNGAAAQAAPSDVQTAPSENMPIFLELDGVPGESTEAPSSPPPPPPPPPKPPSSSGGTLPMEEIAFNYTKIETSAESGAEDVAAPQGEQAALLVPAVQRVRESAARAGGPQMDGVVLLNQEEEQAAKGTGTLTLSNGGQAIVPEMPICPHCGADAEVQAGQQRAEQAEQQRERPRRSFSLTIGGVTVGTGGVNVAVGDVTGDGRGESRSRRPARAPAAGTR